MSKPTTFVTKLTYDDYVCYPEDGNRHEIIDGRHYMNPAPSTVHQTVSKRLQYLLYTQIELAGKGVVFNAPVDVQLTQHDIVQPDLVVVLNSKKLIVTHSRIEGVPDLVVEIVSPSTIANDRELKRSLYQQSGVTEYWIVDPLDQTLDQLILRDGVYVAQPASDDVVASVVDGVSVPLAKVW